jgi:tripartite-type tricarboxylate transporter receptor subunit TctC
MRKALWLAFLCLFAGDAAAQAFPNRPIALVVPFSAGGPTDTLARILAERMGRSLNQSVIVENTTGAGGSIGVGRIARGAPDGYLLGIGHIGTHVVNGAIYPLPYDLLKDLEPVAMVATNPQVIVSRTTVPARDLKELLAWIKANNGRTSSGTGGAGTPSHVSSVYLQKVTGLPLNVIHYRGAAPAMADLMAGHIDISFDQAASALTLVRAGKVRAYAVTQKERVASAPDIPTTDEAGLPGFYMQVWHGIWAPKGTPQAVVARLNGAIVETLADGAVLKRFTELGQEIPPRAQQAPAALAQHHKAEIEKWWPLIKAAGIQAN